MSTPDLSTTYLGMRLSNPLVPSASPLGSDLENLKRMEDAGAGAVVLPSLFEEQIVQESHELDYLLSHGTYSYAEALTVFGETDGPAFAPERYLALVERAKKCLSIPVIASLNGVSNGGWIEYAMLLEQAGADALELNLYFVSTSPSLAAATIENELIDVVRSVKRYITIPLAVKLSPFFTNLASVAQRLDDAGANGLVLFNRFQPANVDLQRMELMPRPTLSPADDVLSLLLPLTWIGILSGRVRASLAASSGIHSAHDVLKMLLVGADATMLASELLLHGIDRLAAIREDLSAWLAEHEYASVAQLHGHLSQRHVTFPTALERAHYVQAVTALPKED
jgi:dihydroorotate dehydrogenase (fumarate)